MKECKNGKRLGAAERGNKECRRGLKVLDEEIGGRCAGCRQRTGCQSGRRRNNEDKHDEDEND